MKTLTLNTNDKETAIKTINAYRLENKNNWYQIDLTYAPNRYRLKCFNTWVQIAICNEDGKEYRTGSTMDINVKQFKQYLYDLIK